MHFYQVGATSENLTDFMRERERAFMDQRLCVRTGIRSVLCPYYTPISHMSLKDRYGGGIVHGSAMGGKLRAVLNFCLDAEGSTLLVVGPWTLSKLEQMLTKWPARRSRVKFCWNSRDVAPLKSLDAFKVTITNWAYLSKSRKLKHLIESLRPERLVIDEFEHFGADRGSKTVEFLTTVPTAIVWLISSRATVRTIKTAVRLLRLDQTFPELPLLPEAAGVHWSLFSVALFENLSFFAPLGCLEELKARHSTMVRVVVERENKDYPYSQIMKAIKHTLKVSFSDRSMHRSLLAFLATIDSGLRQPKHKMMEMLLTFSGNERSGGAKFVPLAPFEELKSEKVPASRLADMCAICQCTLENPVRNSACRDAFCYACLFEWNILNSSCPLCRRDFAPAFLRLEFRDELETKRVRRSPATLEQAQWVDNGRENMLRNRLKAHFDHVLLIVTHYRRLVPYYHEVAVSELGPEDTVAMVGKELSYLNQKKIFGHVFGSPSVIVTLASNMAYFAADERIKQVVLMDTNGFPRSLNLYHNYFRHALVKMTFYNRSGLQEMYAEAIARSIRSDDDPIVFERTSARAVLNDYLALLQKGFF